MSARDKGSVARRDVLKGLSGPPGHVSPKVYTEPGGPDRWAQRITESVLERMRRNV